MEPREARNEPVLDGMRPITPARARARAGALGEHGLRRGVQDVVALTGDAHPFHAGTARTEEGRGGRAFATKPCAGSPAAPNAGPPPSRGMAPLSAPALARADRAATPALAFSDAAGHGYALVQARGEAGPVATG